MSARVAEAIAADLRQRILRDEVDEANFPRQDDLMRQFNVSGPSVREALRILEAEGLITVRRGKFGGAYVHKPNWASAAYAFAISLQGQGVKIRDLAQSILTLEPLCAAGCASRKDRATTIVPRLRAKLDKEEPLIEGGARYSSVAREFHDLLVTGLSSESMRLLTRSVGAVWSVQERIWADAMSASAQYPPPDRMRASHRTHVAMVDLIEAGDVEGVTELTKNHLAATQAYVLERFADETVDASSLAAVQAFKSL